MNLFAQDDLMFVTTVQPALNGLLRIKAKRKTLATLTPAEAAWLGIAAGTKWTTELTNAAIDCERARAGLKCCLRWLAAADRTTHELRDRLLAKQFSVLHAEAALTLLAATKLQSDVELAHRTHQRLAARGKSNQIIRDVLAQKGISLRNSVEAENKNGVSATGRFGAGSLDAASDAARAKALARDVLMNSKLAADPQRAIRRTLSALARAGFEEAVAFGALRAALPREHRGLLDEST
jgi:SOS response regulatory protein OraA/RecX